MTKKRTANAIDILNRRHPPTADDLELREQFRESLAIGELIFAARAEAGLTQRELAKKVGTTASVICRLEDADYEGHSLPVLRRIAAALGRRIEMRLVPERLPAS
jgi:ribosome-binding protein aMBF1 (putative translation factor)